MGSKTVSIRIRRKMKIDGKWRFAVVPLGASGKPEANCVILNQTGKTEFVNHQNGGTAEVVFEVSRAKGDIERCRVGYHVRSTINGKLLFDRGAKIDFGQTESLAVRPAEEYIKAVNPTTDPKVTPPTYILQVEQNEEARRAGQGEAFVFSDKAWAEALENAMTRAMAFCAVRAIKK